MVADSESPPTFVTLMGPKDPPNGGNGLCTATRLRTYHEPPVAAMPTTHDITDWTRRPTGATAIIPTVSAAAPMTPDHFAPITAPSAQADSKTRAGGG